MNLRESLVLLLMGAIVPSVVADLKNIDKPAMKREIRKRVLCPKKYSAYSKNCTNQFDSGIKKCREVADKETLKLEETSRRNSEKLILDTDKTCQAFSECGNDGYDISSGYQCVSEQSSNSAVSMKKMSYAANVYKLRDNREKQAIEKKMHSCTNSTTEELNMKMHAGLDALKSCLRTGTWKVAAVPTLLPQPITAPALAGNSDSMDLEHPDASAALKETATPAKILEANKNVSRSGGEYEENKVKGNHMFK